jgi:hypothetical protein
MRSVTWWLCLVVAAMGLMMVGSTPTVFAEEEGGSQQMAERRENQPPPRPEFGVHRGPTVVAPTPGMEGTFWRALRVLRCVAWALFACNVLLAVWIFMDIRKRGEGNGIFIALALLAGFPAAVVYSLVRIGDKKG